eukprot:CAMPEP_0179149714 /NCGR_PEP_ID=MMETSP0796-20121207/72550_1 /TAXON_ID=73915 /ORGANISM="Pyrodinium bahamense, Strain pbaha01" /LENGTH=248 /DNA_ID=CAMNT_0020850589 /DNA_START=51 /DNA_END=795 /DNA_ORIENTATION=-
MAGACSTVAATELEEVRPVLATSAEAWRLGNQLGYKALWLPAVTSRPVFFAARGVRVPGVAPTCTSSTAALLALGLPLAAVAVMPPRAGGRIGTALRLEMVTELADGHVQARAVGFRSFRVLSEGIYPLQSRAEERAPAMSNLVSISWFLVPEAGSRMACTLLRRRICELLQAARLALARDPGKSRLRGGSSAALWDEPPEAADDADFSWWVAARLPLPPTARGVLLHVPAAEERLSVCAAVLQAVVR